MCRSLLQGYVMGWKLGPAWLSYLTHGMVLHQTRLQNEDTDINQNWRLVTLAWRVQKSVAHPLVGSSLSINVGWEEKDWGVRRGRAEGFPADGLPYSCQIGKALWVFLQGFINPQIWKYSYENHDDIFTFTSCTINFIMDLYGIVKDWDVAE